MFKKIKYTRKCIFTQNFIPQLFYVINKQKKVILIYQYYFLNAMVFSLNKMNIKYFER